MKQYRLLNEGEIIEEGDEVWWNRQWMPSMCAGSTGDNAKYPYRRPLSPEPAWIPIAERKPTEEDGNGKYACVLFLYPDGHCQFQNYTYWNLRDEMYFCPTHWCRIPAFQKEESPPAATPITMGVGSDQAGGAWVKTSERAPRTSDGDKYGKVATHQVTPNGHETNHLRHWSSVAAYPEIYVYWMSLPPPSEQPNTGTGRTPREWWILPNQLGMPLWKQYSSQPDKNWVHVREVLPQPSGTREGRGDSKVETPIPREIITLLGQAAPTPWRWGRGEQEGWIVGCNDEPISEATEHPDDAKNANLIMAAVNFVAQLAKSAEGSEVPTPLTATDDGRKPKSKALNNLERLLFPRLISALRKVADKEGYPKGHIFTALADELEKD